MLTSRHALGEKKYHSGGHSWQGGLFTKQLKKWEKAIFLLGCYGCIFHGTGNSAQLCQNFGISGGIEHPKPSPSVCHCFETCSTLFPGVTAQWDGSGRVILASAGYLSPDLGKSDLTYILPWTYSHYFCWLIYYARKVLTQLHLAYYLSRQLQV